MIRKAFFMMLGYSIGQNYKIQMNKKEKESEYKIKKLGIVDI